MFARTKSGVGMWMPSLILLACALAVSAQIPGGQLPTGGGVPTGPRQTPGQIPGQTPPITIGPNGIPPILLPGGGTVNMPGPRNPAPGGPGPAGPVQRRVLETKSVRGIVREAAKRQLTLETDDYRIIWFRLTKDMNVDKDGRSLEIQDLPLGDRISVQYDEDDMGFYTATWIVWLEDGLPADRERTAAVWDLQGKRIEEPEEENERPVLRRRGTEVSDTAVEETAAAEEPAPNLNEGDLGGTRQAVEILNDATITEARLVNQEFQDSLPNFSTNQMSARYIQYQSRGEWVALDVVTATLVYRGGVEQYANIEIGNDAADVPLDQIEGMRTTGEFGTMLAELFNPAAGTVFTTDGRDSLRNRDALVYKYRVPRERSRWRVETPSERTYPAYSGRVWLDRETLRVLRIEQEAQGLPREFPFDLTEVSVDYDFVRLDAGAQFLLPVESEALYCIRGSSVCRRNHTDFRNYTKFDALSQIEFGEVN